MRFLLLIFLTGLCALPLTGQFGGGPGDGHDGRRTTQADLTGVPAGVRPLYTGGPDDGHGHLQLNDVVTAGTGLLVLYGGGRGDGHDRQLAAASTLTGNLLTVLYAGGPADGFDQELLPGVTAGGGSVTALYTGGTGDGHTRFATYALNPGGTALMLYAGGAGDGHDRSFIAASGLTGTSLAMLYGGGIGDGHSQAERVLSFIPFPLTLVRFDATDHGTYILLEWETEDEVDTDYFTVQRTTDGSKLDEVGNLAAAGFTLPGERRTYSLQDDAPLSGTSYYRLRVTDFDGALTFSDFVPIQRGAEATNWDFVLYPNPGTGTHFQLRPDQGAGPLTVEVYDNQGRKLTETTVPAGTQDEQIVFPRRLPPGSYLIRATDGAGRSRVKVLLVGR
ncbi:T9SS type A sorting domain-containing protein [Lewinella sp. IMCC34191]|uniref:T9SS type A sorting domain-containing protein n=1 Tax=Lewinella sp. IMCC34191 TaxID=2259172 RepID=UPI000E23347B|nr:T9SS type A sorting domain-containing protein [Lewinella sp. IMCC34191]